ncbi:MAG: hypothetical protein LBF15_04195, partial [Candidatus Peribacteria bacterium]|nr:hypothetical protein [Candidatus Peribacteria bacterium]
MTDAIDSFLVQGFTDYKGAKLLSVTNGDIELEKETKKEKEDKEKKSKDL